MSSFLLHAMVLYFRLYFDRFHLLSKTLLCIDLLSLIGIRIVQRVATMCDKAPDVVKLACEPFVLLTFDKSAQFVGVKNDRTPRSESQWPG